MEDGSLLVTALELGHRQLEDLFAAVAERRAGADEVVARGAVHAPPAWAAGPRPRAFLRGAESWAPTGPA